MKDNAKKIPSLKAFLANFPAVHGAPIHIGNPAAMAGGIAEALITTAAGLLVAIPALVAYRYLRGRVDALVIRMEKESIKLVQAIDRTSGTRPAAAQDAAA